MKKAVQGWAPRLVLASACIGVAALAACASSTGDDQGNPSGEDSGSAAGDAATDSGKTTAPEASVGAADTGTTAPDAGGASDAGASRDATTPDASSTDAGADARDASSSSTVDAGDAARPVDAGAPRDATVPDASGVSDASLPPGTLADAAPLAGLGGTAGRPMLTTAQAADYGILQYLARAGSLVTGLVEDDWNPTAGVGDVSTFTPSFVVAAGSAFPTVQSAIDAATGTSRVFIRVMPGTYNEVVCVLATRPPITLYSTNADASQTVIAFDNFAGEAKAVGARANTCVANTGAATFGTSGSATFSSLENGFEAKNITFANTTSLATLAATTGTQAVATPSSSKGRTSSSPRQRPRPGASGHAPRRLAQRRHRRARVHHGLLRERRRRLRLRRRDVRHERHELPVRERPEDDRHRVRARHERPQSVRHPGD